jgi:hypothetical protein
MAAGSPVPHPEYLITLIAPGSGAGDGVPGAAVREAASGRIVDLVPGRNDVYSAVTGTGDNRLFYLAARSSHAETAEREPEIGRVPTRLAEVEVADGRLVRIAFERAFRDPGNIIYGWGPMVIDPSGQHVLIAYTGHLARIDLSTGQLTELPITENGAHSIAW